MSTSTSTDKQHADDVIDVPESEIPTAPTKDEPAVEGQDDEPEEPEPTDKPGREAARYRRQLRETQASLEAAQEATTAAQRALVEHLAATQGRLRQPSALWAAGTELADLLDEAGNVEPGKVSAAVEDAARNLGLTRAPRPDLTQGRGTQPAGMKPDFADAFRPDRQASRY